MADRPLRIMHISTRLILGGSQENTVLSCEGQLARGHDVALVYGPIYGPEGSLLQRVDSFRTDDNRQIQTIETPNLVRDLSPTKDLKCLGDLRKIIRDWKPDVVHTHSSKAGIFGRLAAWRQRVPCVIHTVHGPPFHLYESKWRNALYILAERIAAKRCHVIACVADAMRQQFLEARIGTPEQYVVVWSGMETELFLQPRWTRQQVRQELGIGENDFVLGTIARLAELKGHDDLLDGLDELLKQHRGNTSDPSTSTDKPIVRMLWVGDGWWRDRLMGRVKAMGLEGQVITTGLVPPEQIPKYLQAMDVLIHPSYREGLPRTVVQALLSGIPVIAFDVDGTREVCIDRETGRLLKPGDLRGLRDAVQWMLEYPQQRQALGQRGREMCRHRFAASTMVEHLLEIYQNVLDTQQRR